MILDLGLIQTHFTKKKRILDLSQTQSEALLTAYLYSHVDTRETKLSCKVLFMNYVIHFRTFPDPQPLPSLSSCFTFLLTPLPFT